MDSIMCVLMHPKKSIVMSLGVDFPGPSPGLGVAYLLERYKLAYST